MPTLQSIDASASPEVQMNENFYAVAAAALFGRKDSTTAGLTFGYYGGIIGGIGTFATIADGTVVLTGSTTNYIEATTAGAVSANTSAFTAGRQPLYTAVTSSTGITTLTDYRVLLPAMSTGSVTYSTLTLATGTITASTPALNITQTWNNAAVAFIAADTNITNTASGAGSMLHRWRVGGVVKASIDYLGAMVLAAGLSLGGAIAGATTIAASGAITATSASPQLTLGVLNTTSGGIKFFGSTSGNVTLAPNVAAGASVTVTLPATSVTLNAAGDLTGTTMNSGVVTTSITSQAALVASSTGPHAIGGATNGAIQVFIQGSFSGSQGVAFNTTLNPSANQSSYITNYGGTINKAGSGTHPEFLGALIQPPTIVAGAAALTTAATVKITDAPTAGATNYALWIPAGAVNFGGALTTNGGLQTFGANDSGGAGKRLVLVPNA